MMHNASINREEDIKGVMKKSVSLEFDNEKSQMQNALLNSLMREN
jgi:hypothetical protein